MKTLIALTALNLLVSGTTLTVVLVAGRKVQTRVAQAETKVNAGLRKFKRAVAELEI